MCNHNFHCQTGDAIDSVAYGCSRAGNNGWLELRGMVVRTVPNRSDIPAMPDLFPITHDRAALLDVQRIIASHACAEDRFNEITGIKTIAGVSQAFVCDKIISGIITLDYRTLDEKKRTHAIETEDFPYIPTFLAFREGKAIISAYGRLPPDERPDLLMFDRCGINHPRFAGLATHIGVLLDIPTIGVTKSILCGTYRHPAPANVGDSRPLVYANREVGWVLKSREGCNPIIVAPGHRVSVNTAIEIVRHCLRGYKLPEPTRQAHIYANAVKRMYGAENHTRQR
uniref:Endonuclease V n=1 Tax=Candidatus Methanogaster sp. ANME-2c ERB4 TaxID=2759911 RepID=A0A7G9YHH9_9EURY|nr:endonuclease V [Methanosarcinales archaeon ANME-2c ERB4]